MKYVRYGEKGQEKPGMIDPHGALRDLSGLITDFSGTDLTRARLKQLADDIAANPDAIPHVAEPQRLGMPVCGIGKCIGIGLNYRDHACEVGQPEPPEPIIFMKATSAMAGPNDPVHLPRNALKADWEIELAIVIGDPARYVEAAHALDHVAGYTICNDISERAFQLEHGGQWTKGKSLDGFGPLGPWLVTPDEIPDPQALDMQLKVDGVCYQSGSTSNMIHPVADIIAYLSQFMTLHSGDVISTGTPAGVGMGQKPNPVYLCPGQNMHLHIAGLGEQKQTVIAAA